MDLIIRERGKEWERKSALRGEVDHNLCVRKKSMCKLCTNTERIRKTVHAVYRAGRPIIRKVLKIRIWVVHPVCLGSR